MSLSEHRYIRMGPSFHEAEHLDIALAEIFFPFLPLGIIRKATNVTLLHSNSSETGKR